MPVILHCPNEEDRTVQYMLNVQMYNKKMYNMFLCLPPTNCVYFAATIVTSLLTSSLWTSSSICILLGFTSSRFMDVSLLALADPNPRVLPTSIYSTFSALAKRSPLIVVLWASTHPKKLSSRTGNGTSW